VKKLYEDYIFLVRTALEGSRADDFGGDFEALLGIAREHNMTNILWYALRKNRSVPTHIVTELQSSHNMLLFKCANQKMTRGELEGLLSSAGIKHMFLKGADVAQLYPSEDMREMADIDVYADLDSHENVKEVLLQAGYSFEGHKGHHDVFHRDPFISVEVHESVLDKQRETGLDAYFASPWELAQGSGFEYRFDPSDNYIFLMGHLFGHFHQGGVGVRFFADMALYMKKYGDELDWVKIDSVFERFGLSEVMHNLKALALHWFGDEPESGLLDEMGEYVFESGSYGKTAHMVMYLANEDGKNSFSAAVKRKLFISPAEMRRRSRAVDRCPLLLPLAYLVRAVKIVFTRFREFRAWMRGVKAADSEAVKKYKEMMRRFGVN
jgi:hypothetical protein